MYKTHVNPTRNPAPTLCHLPDAFFKDLQTNFPGICRAYSAIHQSYFTLRVFTQNRRKSEPPQHKPATRVAIKKEWAVSLYVTLDLLPLISRNRWSEL
jgi:hypothetical protein